VKALPIQFPAKVWPSLNMCVINGLLVSSRTLEYNYTEQAELSSYSRETYFSKSSMSRNT